MRPIAILSGILVVAAVLFVAGALLPVDEGAPRSHGYRDAAPGLLSASLGTPGSGRAVAALRRRVAARRPTLAADHAALGLAYLQQARSEADPALYADANRALSASLRVQGRGNFEAALGKALLAGARHDFRGQLRWARRAAEINPYNAQAVGVAGDALLELGATGHALAAYQRMVDLRPDFPSFTRVSYAAQVRGDDRGAVTAARRALGFARGSEDTAAWAHWHLAELFISTQRLDRAQTHLDRALALVPDFGPALEASAHVAAARGETGRAIGMLSSLVQRVPLPANYSFLGELFMLQGRKERAEEAFRAADERLANYLAHDVRPDVDFVTFWADRRVHPAKALRVARRLYRQRTSAAVSDALAWALYANGRLRRAERYAREAIQRSPGDAGIYYHAGMIALEAGDESAARSLLHTALRTDPYWSIGESQRARLIVARLERNRSGWRDGAEASAGNERFFTGRKTEARP